MQKIAMVAAAAFLVLYASSCKDDKQPETTPNPPINYDDNAKLKI
jgi:hypothetical protein